MSNVIWLTDRSRTTTDWKCPRARYHAYHAYGRGINPPKQGLELFLGTELHTGLSNIAIGQRDGNLNIDVIASTASSRVHDHLMRVKAGDENASHFAKEQSILVEALLRGFHRHVWPTLIAQYPDVVAVEQEMTYPLSDRVTFMSKPDLVLGDDDGMLHYIEYKSTSSKSDSWVNQWDTAVQLHSTVRAVGHTLGKQPIDVTVVGLYKGYQSYGKQNSPLVYAYYRQGSPPFSYPEYSYEYKSGFKKVPVWELDGGLEKWINDMPDRVLGDQFPMTAPIYVKDILIERFFEQRLLRETEISEAIKVVDDEDMPLPLRQQFMDGFFPMKFDACQPGFGHACNFKLLCHSGINDPLSQGWTLREPHHDAELKQQQEQEKEA